jgi:hypothetical protein
MGTTCDTVSYKPADGFKERVTHNTTYMPIYVPLWWAKYMSATTDAPIPIPDTALLFSNE